MEPKSMYSTNMIFVSGTICSGKSYLGKELADSFDYDFVEISRIVGGILSSNMRNDLQGHPELDVQITLEQFDHYMTQDEELGIESVKKYITLNNYKKERRNDEKN